LNPTAEQLFRTDERPLVTVARNVSTRWLAIIVDTLLGLVMLPLNLAYLGPAAYGLWALTASITIHFSLLHLGYGGSMVKFMAQYRAQKSVQAVNEIASTLFFVFAAAGVLAYGIAVLVAFNIDAVFHLTPAQASVGQTLLLIIAIPVALNFPFSVYGGIVTGFQRQHVNGGIAIGVSVLVAAVNATVLVMGYGLITLVTATTVVRVAAYFLYRWNALRIYPALKIRWSLFCWKRLREVTGFSVYTLVIDCANRLNYQCDTLVIGAFLGAAPIALWTAASRIILGTQTLTNQLNGVLFPTVVDCATAGRRDRLREIFLQGLQLSLVMVVPIATALVVLGDPLIRAWVGPQMLGSVPALQILAVAVAIRVGNGTATTLLKGAGGHRMLAAVNFAVGVGNVLLSILLVRRFGLAGVAFATLAAVICATLILSPAACRRVDVPVTLALRRSVVPALWPSLIVGGALILTRDLSAGGGLIRVLAHAGGGWLLYIALFFLAIRREERAAYIAKAQELLRRTPFAESGRSDTSPSAAA
jgi:O-antigen/teichoic acid export membrane protein